MAFKQEKNGDIVIYGYEQGIQPSPLKGLANIQNANIATETGELMASYGRVQQSMTDTGTSGTLAFADSSHVSLAIAGSNNLFKGMWVVVTGTTHGGELANGTYWVTLSSGSNFQLSATYGGSTITGFTAGLTATISLAKRMGVAVDYAIETYRTSTQQFYRYYILDAAGLVWVYDSQLASSTNNIEWFLPNTNVSYFSGGTAPSGIAVLNGWLMVFAGSTIYCKPTVDLGRNFAAFQGAAMNNLSTGGTPHPAFVGHQGKCYYGDGNYIGSIFPDSSLLVSGLPNIQSYSKYTASTTTGTLTSVITGSLPNNGLPTGSGGLRVPAFFFTDAQGTQPTNLTAGTVYYIENNNGATNFQVFAAATAGAAINIETGAVGNQYFNTFYPISAGGLATTVYTPQRVNLPIFEVVQCFAEIGNTIVVGCAGNIIYPWNQIDPTPSSIVALPENNTKKILTVNQMAYVFAGAKGNVYITDGNTASLVIKVPDYCAGVPGAPQSYVEPIFRWGGVAYIRGRVYFAVEGLAVGQSVATASGIWSFIPTQNLYIGQDTGIALRLENQNSYGTYDGLATVIVPTQPNLNGINQGNSPQFWSAWYSAEFNASTNGIDFTASTPIGNTIVESDLIPVGTVLNKYTPKQLEYKLTSPLVAGETVAAYWRKNSTDAWTSFGTVITPDGPTSLSGYFQSNLQGAQWVQTQLVLTPLQTSSTSFTRLASILMR